MASHPRSIHHLYDRYRSTPSMDSKGPALRNNRPQDVEDRHDDQSSPRGYYNDVPADSWLRGGGAGGATGKPGFDKGQSYRRADGGNNWHSQTPPDKVSFVKPEPVTANKQQRRTGG